jgi:hypothetical protein
VTFFATFFEAGLPLALLDAFFTALVLEAALEDKTDFAGLDFLPPKILSQPLAYFSLVPTRVIVTAFSPNTWIVCAERLSIKP